MVRKKKKSKKKGFLFDYKFSIDNHAIRKKVFEEDVYSNLQYQEHIRKVSLVTNIDEQVIQDVLRHFFEQINHTIWSISNNVRHINICSYFKLVITPKNQV